jgi:hypothetical protein
MAQRKKKSSKQKSEDVALTSQEKSSKDALPLKKKAADDALASKTKSSADILTLKLDAERRKSEAERVKLWLEAEEIRKRLHRKWHQDTSEIRKRLHRKWHQDTSVLKWAAAGIVVGVLLLTWVIGYVRPVFQYEQEIAGLRGEAALLESQKLAHQNAIDRAENEQRAQELQRKDKTIKEELAFLAAERENLQILLTQTEEDKTQLAKRYVRLASDYDNMAQRQQFTERQRVQFANLAESVSVEAEALTRDIIEVQKAVQESEVRVRTIQTQLDTREIRGTKTRIVHSKKSAEDAAQIERRLSDLGADVQRSPYPEKDWTASTALFYYDDSTLASAIQIQSAIADIVQMEMIQSSVLPVDWKTSTPKAATKEDVLRPVLPLASWLETTLLQTGFELVLMLE